MKRVTEAEVEEMCRLIVRLFMYGRPLPPQITARVHAWLSNGRQRIYKDNALQEVFNEIMEGKAEYGGYPDGYDRKVQHIN